LSAQTDILGQKGLYATSFIFKPPDLATEDIFYPFNDRDLWDGLNTNLAG
jgi:hypothetical protein